MLLRSRAIVSYKVNSCPFRNIFKCDWSCNRCRYEYYEYKDRNAQ